MKSKRTTIRSNSRPLLDVGLQQSKSLRNSKQGIRKVNVSAAKGTIMTNPKPIFTQSRGTDGRIVVSRREHISTVFSTTTGNFAVQKFSLNPGLVTTFPWLATTCGRGYESYSFKKLSFEFISIEPTSVRGQVVMGVDYDPRDDPPTSKQVLMNTFGSVAGPVWESFTFHCDSDDLKKFGPQRFIRGGALPSHSDIKTYDVGNFYICCVDHQYSLLSVGDVYVSYTVELMTPQYDPGTVSYQNTYYAVASGLLCNPETPFGGLTDVHGGLSVNITPTTIKFHHVGKYLVRLETNTSSVPISAYYSVSGSCSIDPTVSPAIWFNDGGSRGTLSLFVTAVQPNDTFILDLSPAIVSMDNLQINIAAYDFPNS